MLLYTSSAGRSGMQVFARVKNAIFSLKPHTANGDIIIVRDEVATFKLPHEWICGGDGAFRTWRSAPRGPLCGSGLWSCGRPWLRPSSFSPPASPAAAPLESEENKTRVFIPAGQLYCDSKERKKVERPLEDYLFHLHIESKRGHRNCNMWTEAPLWTLGGKFTCFSACLRSSRKRSSSWTQAGSSFWPCCLAFSSCVFSSRSTRSSCASRACRVRDTCRSNSRSREVRSSPSRPLTGTGGWERMKGRG